MLSEYEKNTWQSLIGPNLNRIKYFEEKIPKFQSPNAFFEPENFVRQQLDESVIVEYFNNNVCIKPIQTYYQNSIWRSPDKYFFSHMAPMDFRTFYHKFPDIGQSRSWKTTSWKISCRSMKIQYQTSQADVHWCIIMIKWYLKFEMAALVTWRFGDILIFINEEIKTMETSTYLYFVT